MNELYCLIKQERIRQHVSQFDLACRVGSSTSYISNLENGKIDPRWSTVLRVLHALDIKLIPEGYLFTL